ncbi:MAG: hypothetical protein RLZZ462_280 [Bacteroidota bacterium]|jgi:hypothetical protein
MAQLHSHKFEYHTEMVMIGSSKFERDSDGMFTCPGCLSHFKTTSSIYKTHKLCVNGSEADVDFEINDDSGSSNMRLNALLQRFGLNLSEQGDCIICTEHECILCKSS